MNQYQQTDLKMLKKLKIVRIFILIGPMIAAIVITLLSTIIDLYLNPETNLASKRGSIAEHFLAMIMLSYVIGVLPAWATSFIFANFLKPYCAKLKLRHFISCAVYSVIIWLPLVLILYAFLSPMAFILLILICIMLISSIGCAIIVWRYHCHLLKKTARSKMLSADSSA
ncbi:hypothetical protein EC844_11484 [Acinetobacter calcoaceticus]|uniref:Uncharacterized protein n=1 Tax=Acinetobacter calcoaceticus TaxID=471 RepID=A0A4V2R0T2_ACICA|nr:hypothetical protein EC844_11484 [Acinetobacter calcoaceticus]